MTLAHSSWNATGQRTPISKLTIIISLFIDVLLVKQLWIFLSKCVCACERKRDREKERGKRVRGKRWDRALHSNLGHVKQMVYCSKQTNHFFKVILLSWSFYIASPPVRRVFLHLYLLDNIPPCFYIWQLWKRVSKLRIYDDVFGIAVQILIHEHCPTLEHVHFDAKTTTNWNMFIFPRLNKKQVCNKYE